MIPPGITYPNQTVALLGYAVDQLYNVAIGGQTMATMIATGPSIVDPKLKRNGAPQITPTWGGTNDLYFGATAATTYSRIAAYCAARKAAGWKVIVLSILPRTNSGTPVTFEADRQTVNASLLADFPTATGETNIWTGASYADALVNVGADTTIGLAGQTTNTTYYLDLVHLTTAGYAIVASYVQKAIQLIS